MRRACYGIIIPCTLDGDLMYAFFQTITEACLVLKSPGNPFKKAKYFGLYWRRYKQKHPVCVRQAPQALDFSSAGRIVPKEGLKWLFLPLQGGCFYRLYVTLDGGEGL